MSSTASILSAADAKNVDIRSTYENSFDMLTPRMALDERGMVMRANAAFCTLVDASFDTLEGVDLFDYIHALHDENGKAVKAITGRGVYTITFRKNHRTNKRLPLDFKFDWLGGASDNRVLVGAVVETAQVLLRDKNTGLDAKDLGVFSALSRDLLVVMNPRGKIIKTNPVFDYIFAGRESAVFADLFEADLHKEIQASIRSTAAHSSVFETHLNTVLYPNYAGMTIKWKIKRDGAFIYALGNDISQLKAQQREVQLREQKLSEAESIGRMGHWHWIIGAHKIHWSNEIYNLFGVADDFTPSLESMNNMISRRDLPRVNRAFQRAMIEHNSYDIEFQINRDDGSIRYVHCEGRCDVTPDGDLYALYGIMQDVTERVLYEKQLRAAKTSAERSYAAKTQFLANMSHELRTPLNAILGFSQMMQQEMLGPIGTPKYLEYVDGIHDSGEHLLNIISDILDMSKIEAGKYELALEEINVHETVTSAVKMVQTRANESGITLGVDHKTPADLTIIADRRAVKQILLNILSNAIKFTKTNGVVMVESFAREGYLALKIKDTGIGIPANKLPYIMRPFEQVSHSYARDHDGSGLGLAITKDFVELHGGGLSVDSDVGIGTTVNIRLPYDAHEATNRA